MEVKHLIVAYALCIIILLIFLPKIYLANNIYYISRNINYLSAEEEALKAENEELFKRLEHIKFNFLTLEIDKIK